MENKIVLVLGTNIHWAPFYYRYENILEEENIQFDLIIWNREGIQENNSALNVYEYEIEDKANNKNPFKLLKFIGFSNYVKKIIKKNKYDKVIFVGTYGCAIAFCSNFLVKNYRDKMWIDIRDDLYEWFKPYYNAQRNSIVASYATAISSHEYTTFLPRHKYYFMHNIDSNYKWMIENFLHKEDSDGRIRISFIGNVRYYDKNKKLINLLGNDKRFKIQYYGNGSNELKEYCVQNGILNVDFHGPFKQKDTIKFYEKTDIINNMYGNDTLNLRVALSNKLYYGLFLELPILVSRNTYMERLANEYNIGFAFEDNETFADDLFDWYQNIKNKNITPRYQELWQRFLDEDSKSIEKLHCFLNTEK